MSVAVRSLEITVRKRHARLGGQARRLCCQCVVTHDVADSEELARSRSVSTHCGEHGLKAGHPSAVPQTEIALVQLGNRGARLVPEAHVDGRLSDV